MPELEQLANELGIKASIWDSVQTLYLPLAEWIAQQVSERRAQGTGGAFVVGLNGAPGSGKSTCDAFIQLILERHFELRVSGFSIDDVYLTKREREKLARSVHPLFKVRGVPGTHDVDLALQVLEQLAQADPAEAISIPVFEKVADDRAARVDWREVVWETQRRDVWR